MLCENQPTPEQKTKQPSLLVNLDAEKPQIEKKYHRGPMVFSEEDLKRFQAKLQPNDKGCWIFTGKAEKTGYGSFWAYGRMRMAHKIAYAMSNNGHWAVLPECICHKCDVKKCCNPDHLFLGTKGINNTDRKNKGRNFNTNGEGNPAVKLKASDVLEIRKAVKEGAVQRHLATKYRVSFTTINDIVRHHSWTCLA